MSSIIIVFQNSLIFSKIYNERNDDSPAPFKYAKLEKIGNTDSLISFFFHTLHLQNSSTSRRRRTDVHSIIVQFTTPKSHPSPTRAVKCSTPRMYIPQLIFCLKLSNDESAVNFHPCASTRMSCPVCSLMVQK